MARRREGRPQSYLCGCRRKTVFSVSNRNNSNTNNNNSNNSNNHNTINSNSNQSNSSNNCEYSAFKHSLFLERPVS